MTPTPQDRPDEHTCHDAGGRQCHTRLRLFGVRATGKILIVLLAVGLATAGHYYLVAPHLRPRQSPQPDVAAWPAGSSGPVFPADPFALASQPLVAEHLQPVSQAPPWVVVLPESHLSYGFHRDFGGMESWSLHYEAKSSPSDVESFYRTAMPKLGYKLVKRTDGEGSPVLSFLSSQREFYWVSIRAADKKDQVEIALAISRPIKR